MSAIPGRPKSQYAFMAFLAVALLCGSFAAFLASRLIAAKGYSGERVRPVVVAKVALSAAQPITVELLDVVNWPESSVPPGAASTIKELFPDDKPRVTTTGILPGEAVVPARLASTSQGVGLAAVVEPGKRGVAVKVDDAVRRSGLVYPGAHVDVISTMRDPEGRTVSTRTAVSNVKVLAVEAETDVATRHTKGNERDGSADTIVTLEVRPDEAEVLSLAAREGKVDLALRNGTDNL